MADVKKYLDFEGLKLYDEKIKALIASAGKTEDEIKAIIASVVGELPEDATEATIVEHLLAKISAVDNKVGDISTLTSETVTTLAGAVEAAADVAAQAASDAAEAKAAVEAIQEYDDTALAARVKAIEDDYLKEADKYNDTELSGKVSTLVGEDANKSVRAIAAEELAAKLIPEDAKESLDTLAEIAAWIQAHPDDAAQMNADIAALKAAVGEEAVAGSQYLSGYVWKKDDSQFITIEQYNELDDEDKADYLPDYATSADKAATGLYKEIADLDKAVDTRLDIVEAALGLADPDAEGSSLSEKLTQVEAKVDAFTAITTDEINGLFTVTE